MDLLKGEIERKRKELEETNVLGVSYLERSFLYVFLAKIRVSLILIL